MERFSKEKLWDYANELSAMAMEYLPRIILAFLVLWLGFKIVRRLRKVNDKSLARFGFSEEIRPFLISVIDVLLKLALFLAAAAILGANLTGFFTIIAAAGFAVGMALQGSLGNFASGILILTLKPYKIGDWIDVDDKFGTVEEIGIFNTTIVTPGKKTLIVPNSKVTDSVVTNYSNKGLVRLEVHVTMPYEENFPKVRQIISEALKPLTILLNEPQPEIGISNFDSHSIEIAVRPYTHPDDYWEAIFETHAAIKKAFNNNQIKVAYSEGVEFGSIGA